MTFERGPNAGNLIRTLLPGSIGDLNSRAFSTWPQAKVIDNPGCSLKLDLLSPKILLCEKIQAASWRLDQLCYVTFGLRSCAKGVGQGTKDRLITLDPKDKDAKPYLEGRDIRRYETQPTGRFIRYLPDEMYSPREPGLFETRKIVSQSMLSKMRIIATLDEGNHYVEQSLVCIVPHGVITEREVDFDVPLEFILGAINSRVGS